MGLHLSGEQFLGCPCWCVASVHHAKNPLEMEENVHDDSKGHVLHFIFKTFFVPQYTNVL